jgi:hypothetical protein
VRVYKLKPWVNMDSNDGAFSKWMHRLAEDDIDSRVEGLGLEQGTYEGKSSSRTSI